ncbi:reverse transcriptase [Phytophthora megakarya]|uniref:Reverse transcriptase n=1 Tax=Phytophthora megakarya TaxID=4795 RepID=A0A225W1D4_9STRA|nr:reverse transcriptase [Phytophthora megakarya]
MQSFLGSLNYYSRFTEDYTIYASVLYELREIDFAAMMKDTSQVRIQQVLEVECVDPGSQEGQAIDQQKHLDPEAQDLTGVDPRWSHAYRSFSVLKSKIATTSILRHFDSDRRATVVVYVSDWAISGSLPQEYNKIYYLVMFASRTLKSNELNYGIAEKDVLALLGILDLNYNALIGPLALKITKCVKGEDEILGALAASITPRSQVDKALISIAPKKEPRRKIQASIPTIGRDEDLYAVSFDGSARVKRVTFNRLDEILVVKIEDEIAQISAVTTRSKARSGVRMGSDPDSLREQVVRELRIERIWQAQDEEWISGLKKYLVRKIRDLTQKYAKVFGSIAMNYDVGQLDLLFYYPTTKEAAADRNKLMRLVVPETLRQDILHHYARWSSRNRSNLRLDPRSLPLERAV